MIYIILQRLSNSQQAIAEKLNSEKGGKQSVFPKHTRLYYLRIKSLNL